MKVFIMFLFFISIISSNDIKTTHFNIPTDKRIIKILNALDYTGAKDYSKIKKIQLAKDIFLSSKKNNVDPILLISLIQSESSFDNTVKHGLNYVIGLGGCNLKQHPEYINRVNNQKDQIEVTAELISYYLEHHDGNNLYALKAYKGWCKVGTQRALAVIKNYKLLKNCPNDLEII